MKDINRDINQPKPFKSELLSRMGGRIEFIDLAKYIKDNSAYVFVTIIKMIKVHGI